MRLQRQSNGQLLTFGSQSALGVGGEARIYAVPQDAALVAKVYHQPTDARARKLAAMLANPPDDPMKAQGHTSIAWPSDLLLTTDGARRIAGFLMPRVSNMRPVIDFYHPKTRRQQCPLFNYLYLLRTARNLAAAVRALHARGYVIGDVNESNILVTDTALVTLVDTDSFQVRDPQNGVIYRCPVGKPEFTPPELQGKTFAYVDRAPEHDLFGLAVLIFQLLMEGTHPFAGVFTGRGEPPPYEARISSGHFPYGAGQRVPYHPMPIAPSFDVLHPTLRQLFVRCFEDGHHNPQARPDAQTWLNALNEAENALVTCAANSQHRYGNHLNACPWCERAARLGGRDPFPSRQAVERGTHLQPAAPAQTPLPPACTQPTQPTQTATPTRGYATTLATTTPIRWGLIVFYSVVFALLLGTVGGLARTGIHAAVSSTGWIHTWILGIPQGDQGEGLFAVLLLVSFAILLGTAVFSKTVRVAIRQHRSPLLFCVIFFYGGALCGALFGIIAFFALEYIGLAWGQFGVSPTTAWTLNGALIGLAHGAAIGLRKVGRAKSKGIVYKSAIGFIGMLTIVGWSRVFTPKPFPKIAL